MSGEPGTGLLTESEQHILDNAITECEKIANAEAIARGEADDGLDPCICRICGKTISRPKDMQRHLFVHTGEKLYKCPLCYRAFVDNGNLKKHLRTHEKQPLSLEPVQCEMCGLIYRSETDLLDHRQRAHPGRQISCHVCQKPFGKTANLFRHMLCKHQIRQSKPLPKFPCDWCGKYFRRSHDLERHRRTHTGERPFTCRVCQRTFTDKSNLQAHMLRYHRTSITSPKKPADPTNKCDVCGKMVNQWSLARHKRLHTGEKPYRCSLCGTLFVDNGNRLKHQRRCRKKEEERLQRQDRVTNGNAQTDMQVTMATTQAAMVTTQAAMVTHDVEGLLSSLYQTPGGATRQAGQGVSGSSMGSGYITMASSIPLGSSTPIKMPGPDPSVSGQSGSDLEDMSVDKFAMQFLSSIQDSSQDSSFAQYTTLSGVDSAHKEAAPITASTHQVLSTNTNVSSVFGAGPPTDSMLNMLGHVPEGAGYGSSTHQPQADTTTFPTSQSGGSTSVEEREEVRCSETGLGANHMELSVSSIAVSVSESATVSSMAVSGSELASVSSIAVSGVDQGEVSLQTLDDREASGLAELSHGDVMSEIYPDDCLPLDPQATTPGPHTKTGPQATTQDPDPKTDPQVTAPEPRPKTASPRTKRNRKSLSKRKIGSKLLKPGPTQPEQHAVEQAATMATEGGAMATVNQEAAVPSPTVDELSTYAVVSDGNREKSASSMKAESQTEMLPKDQSAARNPESNQSGSRKPGQSAPKRGIAAGRTSARRALSGRILFPSEEKTNSCKPEDLEQTGSDHSDHQGAPVAGGDHQVAAVGESNSPRDSQEMVALPDNGSETLVTGPCVSPEQPTHITSSESSVVTSQNLLSADLLGPAKVKASKGQGTTAKVTGVRASQVSQEVTASDVTPSETSVPEVTTSQVSKGDKATEVRAIEAKTSKVTAGAKKPEVKRPKIIRPAWPGAPKDPKSSITKELEIKIEKVKIPKVLEVKPSEVKSSEAKSSKIKRPEAQVQKVRTSEIDPSEAKAPVVKGPEVKPPKVKAKEVKPLKKIPEEETSEVSAPKISAQEINQEVNTPLVKAYELKDLDLKTPEVKTPETKTPETTAPDVKAPKVEAQEVKAPVTSVSPEGDDKVESITPVIPEQVAGQQTTRKAAHSQLQSVMAAFVGGLSGLAGLSPSKSPGRHSPGRHSPGRYSPGRHSPARHTGSQPGEREPPRGPTDTPSTHNTPPRPQPTPLVPYGESPQSSPEDTQQGAAPRVKDTHQGAAQRVKDTHQGAAPRVKDTHQGAAQRVKDTHQGAAQRVKDTHQGAAQRREDTKPGAAPRKEDITYSQGHSSGTKTEPTPVVLREEGSGQQGSKC